MTHMTAATTSIRLERPEDVDSVRVVNQRAFGGDAEAKIVDVLRAMPSAVSLVALINGQVTGHILFTPVEVERVPEGLKAVGLAPLAVLPEEQRHGIGTALVRKGLDVCRLLGYGLVVVLGHPEFYPRFGFKPASDYGLHCVYPAPAETFMVLELRPGTLKTASGLVKYQPEFGAA
jgi:putative acetyltransferase